MIRSKSLFVLAATISVTSFAHAGVTTFDDPAADGWAVYGFNDGTLGDFNLPTGGNPGANLNLVMVDTFGVNLRNDTNAAVLGDYSRFSGPVTFAVDLKVNHIIYDPFFDGVGNEVTRHLVVELMDYNPDGSDYPYTSVWYDFGEISRAQTNDWTTLSTTIADTTSATLPAGWGGYGAENPVTFEPELPAGRTFASVLASVDEIRFTTYVPGYFYGFTQYDLQYDNVSVVAVPEPTTAALLIPFTIGAMRRRRTC